MVRLPVPEIVIRRFFNIRVPPVILTLGILEIPLVVRGVRRALPDFEIRGSIPVFRVSFRIPVDLLVGQK
jgi:hypothetical protein